MQSWLMPAHPGLMILYGLGLCGCLMDKKWRTGKGLLTWIGAAAAVTAAALLILDGASLWEGAAWLLVLILITMGVKE
ncbi:MAG: hypothetical protein IJR97_02135 [Clostridia bacterium]|nr:hypothetical protein [Clostridia bacterium]